MSDKQKVLLVHLLTLDNRFLDELASRSSITKAEARQVKAKRGDLERLDALIKVLKLPKNRKPNLARNIGEVLEVTNQSCIKNYISAILENAGATNDDTLLLKIQKKRALIKETLRNPKDIAEEMMTGEFLNNEQMKTIKSASDNAAQTNKLLNAIVPQGQRVIRALLDVLKDQGYSELVEEIQALHIDEAGQLMEKDEIYITIRLLEKRTGQESNLMDMPKDLVSWFKDLFKPSGIVGKKYGIVVKEVRRGPFVVLVKKTKAYNSKHFINDLLQKQVAGLMQTEMRKLDTKRWSSDKISVVLDVNMDQLGDIDAVNGRDCPDGAVGQINGIVSDEDEDSADVGESEDENENCDCDGNGGCIEVILQNYRTSKGNRNRTDIVHKTAVEMIKKFVTTSPGGRQYVHAAQEIYQTLVKNLKQMSFELVKRSAPLTVLHVCVFEGRLDVLQVLFDCGLVREFRDTTVKDDRSAYKGKNIDQIILAPPYARVRERLQEMFELEESLTWLHRCAQIGQHECVLILLSRHPHLVNKKAKDECTALHYAISSGSLDVVRTLVDAGASLGSNVKTGETLLSRAVEFGHVKIAEYLLSECGCDVRELGKEKTPIQWAVKRQDVAMMKLLLRSGAHADEMILMEVARGGNLLLMQAVKECGQYALDFQDSEGRSPLLLACEKGHMGLVKMMVEDGASIDMEDMQGRNLLHKAAESKNGQLLIYVCELLEERGRLQNMINKQDKYLGQERCFVVRGRDNGIAAFHYVEVERHYMHVFRQITRDGGTVDVARYGNTFRSGWGANPPAEVLAEVDRRYKLSNVMPNSKPDLTPLNLCILREFPEGAETLALKYNADVSIPDCFGATPLHIACMRGNFNLVRLLVEKRQADVDVEDEEQRTAAIAAEDNRHMNIYNYITGARILKSPILETFRERLAQTSEHLSPDKLKVAQEEGKDMQRKVIEHVRELQEEINSLLFEFGNASIQEEQSVPTQQEADINTAEEPVI